MYLRVLRRFWVIIALGFLLAASLAFLSFVRVSFDHGKPQLAYRLPETWTSTETLLISAKGTPWARIRGQSASETALAGLSSFYATLGNSDPVQRRLKAMGPVRGAMLAQAVTDPTSNFHTPLPFVKITGSAASPAEAISIASRGGSALIGYVLSEQNGSSIPSRARVHLSVLTDATPAKLFAGRKKTLPIVIFITIMVAAIGLAFVLENLRPRIQIIEEGKMPTTRADRQSA